MRDCSTNRPRCVSTEYRISIHFFFFALSLSSLHAYDGVSGCKTENCLFRCRSFLFVHQVMEINLYFFFVISFKFCHLFFLYMWNNTAKFSTDEQKNTKYSSQFHFHKRHTCNFLELVYKHMFKAIEFFLEFSKN